MKHLILSSASELWFLLLASLWKWGFQALQDMTHVSNHMMWLGQRLAMSFRQENRPL